MDQSRSHQVRRQMKEALEEAERRHQQEMKEALQDAALRHVTHGVTAGELSAEGRFDVLETFVNAYVQGWVGLPPGFMRYADITQGMPIDFGEGVPSQSHVMHLADTTSDVDLFVNSRGQFLGEKRSANGQVVIVVALSDDEVISLLQDPAVFKGSVRRMRTALQKRKTNTLMQSGRLEVHLDTVNI